MGERDNEKSGCGETVKATVVVCISAPEVPVMVTAAGPMVAQFAAVKVSVLVPPAVMGLNDAVTPLGMLPTAKLTAPLKPLRSVTAIVLLALPIYGIVTLPDVADSA